MKTKNFYTRTILVMIGFLVGFSQTASPQGAHLKAHWKLDETSGIVAEDATMNGFDVSLNNTTDTNWVAGYNGGSLLLNGANQDGSIAAPASDAFKMQSFSVAAWVRNNAPMDKWGEWIISHGDNWGLYVKQDLGTQFYIHHSTGWAGTVGMDSTVWQDNAWHHVAATYDAETGMAQVYRDGMLVGEDSIGVIDYSMGDGITIGSMAGGRNWDGNLDDVRVYDGVLSSTEVQGIVSESSLVAYYKLDESSGTVASDASSNGFDVLLNNTTDTNWVAGYKGGSLLLNGANQDGSIAAPASDVFKMQSFSVSAWVRNNAPMDKWGEWIIGHGDNWGLYVHENLGIQFYIHHSTGWAGTVGMDSTVWQDNAWHHVAASYDAETGMAQVYRDGMLVGEDSIGVIDYSMGDGFTIGSMSGGRNWDGNIDEVRIFKNVITPADVKNIIAESGLLAHWKLDETSGNVASDVSDNGFDVTLNNTTDTNWVAGYKGGSLLLNGVDQDGSIAAPASDAFKMQSFSVAAWVRNNAPMDKWGEWIISHGDNWGLYVKQDLGTQFYIHHSTGWAGTVGMDSTVWQDNSWHHVAATYDAETGMAQVYRDGMLVGEDSIGVIDYSMGDGITVGSMAGGRNWDGNLDDIRVYNLVLDQDQIRNLAGFEPIEEKKLIVYWPFQQTSDTIAYDESENIYDLPLVNTDDSNWEIDFTIGKSLKLDGVEEYGVLDSITSLNFHQPTFSIVNYIKMAPGSITDWSRIAGFGDAYGFNVNEEGKLGLWCNFGSGWHGSYADMPTLADGKWHQVAMTHDDETGNIFYLDGEVVLIQDWSDTDGNQIEYPGNSLFVVGAVDNGYAFNNPLPANLNDMMIFSGVLSQTEIQDMMKKLGGATLVAHYTMDGAAGDSVIVDDSGNGFDVPLVNGTDSSWEPGVVDGSLALNGTDQYGLLAAPASAPFALQSFTISAYVKLDENAPGWSWVAGYGDNYGLVLNRDGKGSLMLYVHTADGWPDLRYEGVDLRDGYWHNIAATYDATGGGVVNLYLEGELVAVDTIGGPIDFSQLDMFNIGCMNGDRLFPGSIDDLRIYAEVRTQEQIKENIAQRFTLTTQVTGNGSVNPDSGQFYNNDIITITAIPDDGWEFKEWDPFAGTIGGSSNPVDVTVHVNIIAAAVFEAATGIKPEEQAADFAVYPNPFSDRLNIRYELVQKEQVTIAIYDVLGKEVKILVDQIEQPGSYTITWDGMNATSNGIYYLKARVGSDVHTQKIILSR